MNIEILAPAGSMESVYAAVRCGADAVYLGGKSFSARQNAANFSDDELTEAVRYCHLHGVAVHQAINTIAFDGQLDEVMKTAVRSAEAGADAFIIQDLGVFSLIHREIPDMPLHASTQMTIHSRDGALIAKEMGFSRVVVSRELSLAQIAEICTVPIEVEAFVHGALCMSVSGQCYMSAMIGSRSANRGLCAQACRLPFSADRTEYNALSLKDLSYVNEISKLAAAGVKSFKIEGRMKRPEYVAAAVSAIRKAAEGGRADTEALRAVFSRSGFTNGYLYGDLGKGMFGIREKEDVVSAKDVLPALEQLYRKETASQEIFFDARIKKGEPITLTAKSCGQEISVSGEAPLDAQNKALDGEQLEKQLSKLGGTAFSLGGVSADIDNGLFVPTSLLNELRRSCADGLEEMIIADRTPRYSINHSETKKAQAHTVQGKPHIRVVLRSARQLDGVDFSVASEAVISLSDWRKADADEKILLALPRFITDEDNVKKELALAKERGFTQAYCNNIAHIKTALDAGFVCHGGYGLNIVNTQSAVEAQKLGLSDFEVSFEMKLTQISALGGELPRGVIAHGRLPLMLTRNCPIKSQSGCAKCTKLLNDRTGRKFPVVCSSDYAEILNSEKLFMADRLDEIRGADFITLMFSDESAEEISGTIPFYINGAKAPESLTRGLYYRGVQ